jgi:hypothetical protein
MRAPFHVSAVLTGILALTAGCDPAAAPDGEEPSATGSSTTCVLAGDDRVGIPRPQPAGRALPSADEAPPVCPGGVPPVGGHAQKVPEGSERAPRVDAGPLLDPEEGDALPCPGAIAVGRDMGWWQCSAGVWTRMENQKWSCPDGGRRAVRREHRSLFACVP